MSDLTSLTIYAARLREAIDRSFHSRDTPPLASGTSFQALALELFALQFDHNPAYRRFCSARNAAPENIQNWQDIPAIPTSAFKELDLTSLPAAERPRVFHSSGTTQQHPSRHFHNADSLALYEASLLPWFQAHMLLADLVPMTFLILTPTPEQAPHSSLAHMFATVAHRFAPQDSLFNGRVDSTGAWRLDLAATLDALRTSVAVHRPVAILGTAFTFVHLLDHLSEIGERFQLPSGSRVLETGGYKGRSRALTRAELHDAISESFELPLTAIVSEYGMSELSSQAYDQIAGAAFDPNARSHSRSFRFPPWARVRIISPETGREVAEGETGLIRVFDLANVWSVMAIQTEDLGIRRGNGFELIGRAAHAEARGCSLMSV
jgi:Acyl-protein synthetase, LuxE